MAHTHTIKGLEQKGFISIKKIKVERNDNKQEHYSKTNDLSESQLNALTQVQSQLKDKDVILLEGVTSSGKTEIYMKIIEDYLDKDAYCLIEWPELSIPFLTDYQLIEIEIVDIQTRKLILY